jgi:hypothetical protein
MSPQSLTLFRCERQVPQVVSKRTAPNDINEFERLYPERSVRSFVFYDRARRSPPYLQLLRLCFHGDCAGRPLMEHASSCLSAIWLVARHENASSTALKRCLITAASLSPTHRTQCLNQPLKLRTYPHPVGSSLVGSTFGSSTGDLYILPVLPTSTSLSSDKSNDSTPIFSLTVMSGEVSGVACCELWQLHPVPARPLESSASALRRQG